MLFPGFAKQIQHMAFGGFAGVIAVLLIAKIAAVYFIRHSWLRARMIEGTPTARVRSGPPAVCPTCGEGQIMKGPPVIGPVTN